MIRISDPFGLLAFLHWNHDWNKFHFNEELIPKALKQLKELGISFLRMDILWSDVHAGHLQYNFNRYDRLLKQVRDHGMEILAVLHYNKIDREGSAVLWNRPPDSFDEFASYVGETVKRYKTLIHHWEIWNEPNLEIYWAGPKDNLRLYSVLLKKSYLAAKKADPDCFVLNGGFTEPIVLDVEHLYQNSMKNYFDGLNIHIFLNPQDLNSPAHFHKILDGVRSVMKTYGDEWKPIWITEAGCPGIHPGVEKTSWFAGNSLTEEEQADWLEKLYEFIKTEPSVKKLFWAFYRDTDHQFHDGTDYFGLVRRDLTPKPAFHRLKHLIENYK